MKFEERVLQQEFTLNDTDDTIVDYIRKNRNRLDKLSIQKVAEELYLVPNAIMRLCKKLGYKGFAEMKFLIKSEDNVTTNISGLLSKNINKTMELINYKTLEEVAMKINNSKTCHFIGVGESLYFCEMMVNNLRCYDYRAEYYQTYREIEYRIEHCDEKDVLFIISASGENARLNNWIREAKLRGVFIVSISHFNENSLASLANIPLFYWGEEQKLNGYNVSDRSGMMIVLRELSEVFWRMYCV